MSGKRKRDLEPESSSSIKREPKSKSKKHKPPTGGYKCEFVQQPPESLQCPVCLLILRDPHLLSCCGAKVCAVCIEQVNEDEPACPLCNKTFTSLLDKSLQRKVLEEKVWCSRKEDGCLWSGELRDLHQHEVEDCDWLLIKCECRVKFARCLLSEHQIEECPNRTPDQKLESCIRKVNKMHEEEMAAIKEHHKQEMSFLEKELESLKQHLRIQTPCEIVMANYSLHKNSNTFWHSSPFYTGPCGYKMCLSFQSDDAFLSVYLCLMKGEHDDKLKWPFMGTVNIQLMNQTSDSQHFKTSIVYDTENTSSCRVISSERGQGWGFNKFIPQAILEAGFLIDDCLKFRVSLM